MYFLLFFATSDKLRKEKITEFVKKESTKMILKYEDSAKS